MSIDRHTPVRPTRRRDPAGRQAIRQRTGVVLAVVGILLFIASNLGARIGFPVLPFDPHHSIGQLAGPALAVIGAALMGRRRG